MPVLKERINERFLSIDLSINPPFPDKRFNIELSNVCNHQCVFCTNKNLRREKRFIDETLLYRILQEAYDLGVYEVGYQIMGEPFASKNLDVYIKKAKTIGYSYVYITTNGSLAVPNRLMEVVDAGLDSIKFSINAATRESYELVHGQDDFEKVIQNVMFCNEYRKTSGKHYKIYASFVVTKNSSLEIKEFKRKYAHLFDDIAFYAVMSRAGLVPEYEGISKYKIEASKTCLQPFNAIHVTCEGYLVPCCVDANLELVTADLNNVSLKEAWYCDEMTQLRKLFINGKISNIHPQCRKCLESGSDRTTLLDY